MTTFAKNSVASRWFAASAGALAIAMAAGLAAPSASATECLLDTNNNGVADAADTDGGATSDGTPGSLACGTSAAAISPLSVAVGSTSIASGAQAIAVGTSSLASGGNSAAVGSFSGASGISASAFGTTAHAGRGLVFCIRRKC